MTSESHRETEPRPEWMDDEQWALSRDREFRALLDRRKRGPFISSEEARRRADITDEEWAAANAELDRILAEEAEDERRP